MAFIHSKLAQNVDFDIFADVKSSISHVTKRVTIFGGAGVADKYTLRTPEGVVTEVSDEDLALIREMDAFKRLEKAGKLKITNERQFNPKGMAEGFDKSAQINDAVHAATSTTTAHTAFFEQHGQPAQVKRG